VQVKDCQTCSALRLANCRSKARSVSVLEASLARRIDCAPRYSAPQDPCPSENSYNLRIISLSFGIFRLPSYFFKTPDVVGSLVRWLDSISFKQFLYKDFDSRHFFAACCLLREARRIFAEPFPLRMSSKPPCGGGKNDFKFSNHSLPQMRKAYAN
jgi:hypothetical protein